MKMSAGRSGLISRWRNVAGSTPITVAGIALSVIALPDDRGIGAEAAAPEAVAQITATRGAPGRSSSGRERSAERRLDLQRREESLGDLHAAHALGFALAAGDRDEPDEAVRAHARERRVVALEVEEVGRRQVAGHCLRLVEADDLHQPIGAADTRAAAAARPAPR